MVHTKSFTGNAGDMTYIISRLRPDAKPCVTLKETDTVKFTYHYRVTDDDGKRYQSSLMAKDHAEFWISVAELMAQREDNIVQIELLVITR